MAFPLPFLNNTEAFLTKLKLILDDYDIQSVIVGLPKNLNGSNSKKTDEVEQFIHQLSSKISIPIHAHDERYSTVAASRLLREAGHNSKAQRSMIDSQAAVFFLQGYLDEGRSI